MCTCTSTPAYAYMQCIHVALPAALAVAAAAIAIATAPPPRPGPRRPSIRPRRKPKLPPIAAQGRGHSPARPLERPGRHATILARHVARRDAVHGTAWRGLRVYIDTCIYIYISMCIYLSLQMSVYLCCVAALGFWFLAGIGSDMLHMQGTVGGTFSMSLLHVICVSVRVGVCACVRPSDSASICLFMFARTCKWTCG